MDLFAAALDETCYAKVEATATLAFSQGNAPGQDIAATKELGAISDDCVAISDDCVEI